MDRVKAENYKLKEEIYHHILNQRFPITTSEVANAMNISSQKASALLTSLCAEQRIKWEPYHGTKGYGIHSICDNYVTKHVTKHSNTSIKIDWEVVTDSDVEFETDKSTDFKKKISELFYEILLDYFF